MPVRNLDKIFRPKRVAVVGASDHPSKVGHTVLRNLISAGFSGAVYPVNPKCTTVQGIKAYPSVACLPDPPDLAVVCIPAPGVPRIIHQCGEAGILGVIVLSAGFREAGSEGRALEDQVRAEAARFDGLRVLGPNCLGAIVPDLRLNASFAAAMPKPGHIAFVSQSGALCTAVLDWALEEEIGFSYFVSIGNMLDVGVADLVDYFGADPHTKSIVLYVESIDEARRFMSAARAFARGKPIVAYKAGRFQDSARAAASHTGAMAGVDAVYEAAFQRAGIVRVYEMDDLFDCAELLARQRMAKGPRLAILTNAGGPGVMESIWFRFRYLFRETTHQMATRFCFIDYDRELAIVAEVEEEGRRKLAGVGRLVADADHQDADYAVLVGDRWQDRGLGSLLTDECLKIARQWRLALVVAETSPMNSRMLAILANRGFELDTSLAPDVVLARLSTGEALREPVPAGISAAAPTLPGSKKVRHASN